MKCSRAHVIRMALGFVFGYKAAPSFAGFIKVWQIRELAEAPVLAVCRVERIVPGADVAPGTLRWRTSARNMKATLTVLRALPVLERSTIVLSYYSYGPQQGGLTQGDAVWPRLSPGQIGVFPLVRTSGRWRLAMEEGRNNIMPAIVPPRPEAPSKARYDFLIGELVNTLCWGRYRDLFQTALYLREGEWAFVPETLMPLMRQNIGQDWQRWAGIAACAVANLGLPRKTLSEIRGASPPRSLATFALRELHPRDYPELMIRRMIEHSDVHEWGSAVTLQEFAKHPLVLKLMPSQLRAPAPGALYIASSIIQADPQTPLLSGALEAAPKTYRQPTCTRNDRYAATNLILDKGSETQFGALLTGFRAAQANDTKLYYEIFSAIQSKLHPRVIPFCAAMLEDRRIFSGEMRFCDLAGGTLQTVCKENFGFGPWNQPVAERDRALRKAAAWVQTQGLKAMPPH